MMQPPLPQRLLLKLRLHYGTQQQEHCQHYQHYQKKLQKETRTHVRTHVRGDKQQKSYSTMRQSVCKISGTTEGARFGYRQRACRSCWSGLKQLNLGRIVLQKEQKETKKKDGPMKFETLERRTSLEYLCSNLQPTNANAVVDEVTVKVQDPGRGEIMWDMLGKFFAGMGLNANAAHSLLSNDRLIQYGFLLFVFTVIAGSILVMHYPGLTSMLISWGGFVFFIICWVAKFMGTETNELYFEIIVGIAVYFAMLLRSRHLSWAMRNQTLLRARNPSHSLGVTFSCLFFG